MVYIEKKKIKNNFYYYHTRSIKVNSKTKKFRRYIGKELHKAYYKEEFLLSLDLFTQKELKYINKDYNVSDLTYSDKLIDTIFMNNIKVSNLKEFDSNIKLQIDKEFPILFIYNSNSIEGSRMPYKEVEKIVLGKKSDYDEYNEIVEAKNSIKCWEFMHTSFTFTMKSIIKLHSILTQELLSEGKPYAQGLKDKEIVVGFDSRPTTPPSLVKEELKRLFKWYSENKKSMFVPQLAFEFYYRYELIHPFNDGNGRTGRFIMNKILIDNGYIPMIVFVENSQKHHRAFVRAEKGHKKYFYDFMFKQYMKSYEKFYNTFFET